MNAASLHSDERVVKAIERFITLTPPDRLSKHVRQMLLEYMSNKFDMLPIDFHLMIDDLINFFDLMDRLAVVAKDGGKEEE